MKTLLVICFFISGSYTLLAQKHKKGIAQTDWSLVYANDEYGKMTDGSLTDLIASVRNGESIRLSWTIRDPSDKNIQFEHFADAKFLTIISDSIVFAQIDPIVGQAPSTENRFITFIENVEWSFCASTLGNNDSMNINRKSGEVINHRPFKCGIKWFRKISYQ